MNAVRRLVVAVVSLAMLAGLAFETLRTGSADAIVYSASVEMNTWKTSGSRPGMQTWAWVHDALATGSERAPSSPTARELLGILDAQRHDSVEYLAESAVALKEALRLRPTSPYTWGNLAEVMYVQGDTGRTFERTLERAIALGPWEPEVQRTVADYGLAIWDEASPSTRAAVATAIANGMHRSAKEMLQIAERRGRLAIACRWLPVAPRTPDTKWIQLCQGTEAIQ